MNTIYAIAAAALVLVGIAAGAAVQGLRLDAARAETAIVRSELAGVQSDLQAANTRIERQSRQADAVQRSLATERSRAVEAERQAADLREQIARDAGTARDGATAPVLRDAVRGLQRTGGLTGSAKMPETCPAGMCTAATIGVDVLHIRDMTPSQANRHVVDSVNDSRGRSEKLTEFFNGRKPDRHRLAVVIHGQVDRLEMFAEPAACIARALAVGAEIMSYRSYPRLRGDVLVSCTPIRPDRAA